MELGKITSKGQMTIPKAIRERCGLHEGDVVAFSVEDDRIVLRKLRPQEGEYLRGLEATMSEWLSVEDDEAYRDL